MDGNYENSTTIYKDCVLKRYKSVNNLKNEVKSLKLLENVDLINVPRVAYVNLKQMYVIESKCRGMSLNHYPDVVKIKSCSDLFQQVELIHTVSGASWGYVSGQHYKNLETYITSKLGYRLKESQLDLKVTNIIFSKAKELLKSRKNVTPCLNQYDLKPSNILFDNDKKVSIIDFDKALFGDPLMDYAKLKWRFQMFGIKIWPTFSKLAGFTVSEREYINVYLILHCVGALAYYETYKYENYLPIVCSARNMIQQFISGENYE